MFSSFEQSDFKVVDLSTLEEFNPRVMKMLAGDNPNTVQV